MILPHPKFLYCLAQPESKRWLMDELERLHPGLRLAYSRPGLYSFKFSVEATAPKIPPKLVFSRHSGFSLGIAKDVAAVEPWLGTASNPLRLHVFGRDPGETKPGASRNSIDACRSELLAAFPERLHEDPVPHVNDWVLDVILPPDSGAREGWFLGCHRHESSRSVHPGAVTRLPPPPAAPSRAWSKLEELLCWSALPVRPGDVAVEIGCAPGGAVVALLDRGVSVIGVDPAAIDPRVVEHAMAISGDFTHLATPVGSLRRDQLPKRVDWLLCDANLAPQVVIRALAHWAKSLRPALRGILFTLKINDQGAYQAIPRLIAQVGEFGLGAARAVQLPSHRSEIAVVAARHRRSP